MAFVAAFFPTLERKRPSLLLGGLGGWQKTHLILLAVEVEFLAAVAVDIIWIGS